MQNNAWKVGAFVTVAAVSLGGVILFFGEIPVLKKDRTEYYAYFKNVGGLSKGSDVRVAGVKVGKVEKITFENGKVKVVLEVKKGVPIYRDAVAKIESLGLLGDKYVEIDPGHPYSGLLKPHSVIAKTETPADVSKLVEKMGEATESINKLAKSVYLVLEENRRQLTELIANLNQLAQTLELTLKENREQLRDTLANLRIITQQLKETLPTLTKNYNLLAKNLNHLLKENQKELKLALANIASLTSTLNKELPPLIESLQQASETFAENRQEVRKTLKNLAEITERIKKGKGTLGKLINDKTLYTELKKSVKTLGKASSVITRTQLHIEAFGQYEAKGDSKAGINVILQPDEKKYYLFGVVGDSAGKVTKKTYYENGQPKEVTEKEYKPEFNLQYARIFKDKWLHKGSSVVLRLGIKESTGGVGVDYVFNERLMFSFDLWDFGREDHPNEDLKPNTELGFKYFVYGPFFVKAGGYDLLNEQYRTVFIGGGMSFTDNDLKYLLGGLKLPSSF